jgi:membrane fusion protein, macrolide-specific efflux system
LGGFDLKNLGLRIKKKTIIRNKYLYTAILSMLFSIALAGCNIIPSEEASIAPPVRKPPPIVYSTEVVKKGTLVKMVQGMGIFVAQNQFNLYFKKQGGRLKTVFFKIGDKVKKGDIIAESDSEDAQGKLDEQRILVEKAGAQDKYKESTAKRNVEHAMLVWTNLKTGYEEMNNEKESFSRDELDRMKDQVLDSEIAYYNLKDSYASMLEEDDYNMKLLKIQLSDMEKESSAVRIISPCDGELTFLDALKISDLITTSKTYAVVSSGSGILLKYTGANASEFTKGKNLDVIIGKLHYEGEIIMMPENVPNDANEDMKNTVFIKIKNMPAVVVIGNTAEIQLTLLHKDNALSVNKSFIQKYMGESFVYLLEDGIRKEVTVQTGIEAATEIEILTGVKEGDKIVQ